MLPSGQRDGRVHFGMGRIWKLSAVPDVLTDGLPLSPNLSETTQTSLLTSHSSDVEVDPQYEIRGQLMA